MWACEANALSVAELLLHKGACPRRVNASGDAALNIALKHGHSTPLVELIKRATATIAPPLLGRRVLLRGLSARPGK